MARLCERPGCSQAADVVYGIDADHLTVWIEPFDGALGYRAGVLCRRHADAMVVPLGWMLDDRREPVPRLFKPKDAVPVARERRHRTRSHARRDDTGQLELDTDETPSVRGDDERPPIDDVAAPWKPVFDPADDLDGLLDADGPLLSRAFGRRDRPPAP